MTMSRWTPVALACAALLALTPPLPAHAATSKAAVNARADFTAGDLARMKAAARRVTIMRDQWDIPHVFGMLYAQAEDDFNCVELTHQRAGAVGRGGRGEGDLARPAQEALHRSGRP